jgi:hypothetical protein
MLVDQRSTPPDGITCCPLFGTNYNIGHECIGDLLQPTHVLRTSPDVGAQCVRIRLQLRHLPLNFSKRNLADQESRELLSRPGSDAGQLNLDIGRARDISEADELGRNEDVDPVRPVRDFEPSTVRGRIPRDHELALLRPDGQSQWVTGRRHSPASYRQDGDRDERPDS